MYIPKHFKEEDKTEIEKLIREFGFATLVSIKENLPWATHIPLELVTQENGDWFLRGQKSRVLFCVGQLPAGNSYCVSPKRTLLAMFFQFTKSDRE